jgi:hypothetical protein
MLTGRSYLCAETHQLPLLALFAAAQTVRCAQASLGGDAADTPTTVRSLLRVEVERLGLELQEGGGRLISQAAMEGVDARVVAYPVTQDILFAVAKVG